MALSSVISLNLSEKPKLNPFKSRPDIEIEDGLVTAPDAGRSALTCYCLLSDLLKSDYFIDEYTGGRYFASHYSARDIATLKGGGRTMKTNARVVDYENLNFADWCVDPSSTAELPTVQGRAQPEPVLSLSEDYIPTFEDRPGVTLGEILSAATTRGAVATSA